MPYVQFTDSTETTVIAVFSCAQDPTSYPNQAEISSTDARYLAYVSQTPTPAQAAEIAAASLLAQGIAITSTGTPAVSGTYSLSQETQNLVVAVATAINTSGGSFPGGVSALPWADASGAEHVFPNVTVFKEFALAIAGYVGAIDVYASSGGTTGALPTSNAVTIA